MVAENNSRRIVFELAYQEAKANEASLRKFGDKAVDVQERISKAAEKSAKAQTDSDGKMSDSVIKNRIKMLARIQKFEDDKEKAAKKAADAAERESKRTSAAAEREIEKQRKALQQKEDDRAKAEEKASQAAEKEAKKKGEEAEKTKKESKALNHELHEGAKKVAEGVENLTRAVVLLGLAEEESLENGLKLFAKFEAAVSASKGAVDLLTGSMKVMSAVKEVGGIAGLAKGALGLGGGAAAAAAGPAVIVGGVVAAAAALTLALKKSEEAYENYLDHGTIKAGKSLAELAEESRKSTAALAAFTDKAAKAAEDKSAARSERDQINNDYLDEVGRLGARAGKTGTAADLAENEQAEKRAEQKLREAHERERVAISNRDAAHRYADQQFSSKLDFAEKFGPTMGSFDEEKHRSDAQTEYNQRIANADQEAEKEIAKAKQLQVDAEQELIQKSEKVLELQQQSKEENLQAIAQELQKAKELRDTYKEAAEAHRKEAAEAKAAAQGVLTGFADLDPAKRQMVLNAAKKADTGAALTNAERKLLQQYGGEEHKEIANKQAEADMRAAGGGVLTRREDKRAADKAAEAAAKDKLAAENDQKMAEEQAKLKKLGVANTSQVIGKIEVAPILQSIEVKIKADREDMNRAIANQIGPFLKDLKEIKEALFNNQQAANAAQQQRGASQTVAAIPKA